MSELNISARSRPQPRRCVQMSDVQRWLSCALCGGYLIDATTISRCLHTCEFLLVPIFHIFLLRSSLELLYWANSVSSQTCNQEVTGSTAGQGSAIWQLCRSCSVSVHTLVTLTLSSIIILCSLMGSEIVHFVNRRRHGIALAMCSLCNVQDVVQPPWRCRILPTR